MESRKKTPLSERYFRRMLRRKGKNFVLGVHNGNYFLASTRAPLTIVPGLKTSTIELSYSLTRDGNKLDELAAGIINMALVRNVLYNKGYGDEELRVRQEGSEIVYRISVETKSKEDLEKVVRDCNSI